MAIEKSLEAYDNDLNQLITDIDEGGRMGNAVFIMRPNEKAGDDLVVMKRRQLLALLMPGGLPTAFVELATDRGGG
jgi:hypothetical protein